jgi:hypothetical protein
MHEERSRNLVGIVVVVVSGEVRMTVEAAKRELV